MESPARGVGRRVRRGRTRDRVGSEPAPTRWMPPGPLPSAPAALVAASGSVSAGHGLPFPSGGGGGRSLRSRAPPPHAEPPSPATANLRPHPLQQDFPTLPELPKRGLPGMHDSLQPRALGCIECPSFASPSPGSPQTKESATCTPFLSRI